MRLMPAGWHHPEGRSHDDEGALGELLLWITTGTSFAMDGSSDHGFGIVELGGRISVSYFDNRDETLEWFESRDLQGGGYTWQALVRAAFELDPSALASDIEYDAEAVDVLRRGSIKSGERRTQTENRTSR